MRLKIGYCEISSLMAKNGINLFFQPTGRRTIKIGINSFLSIPVELSIMGGKLNCKYSSGLISGRVVNALLRGLPRTGHPHSQSQTWTCSALG